IKEELGDRSGIASSYHQLGMIAELRSDYQQAENHYRASLAIDEELGDRSGIATSFGQLGVLRTVQERPAEGVPYLVKSLSLQLEIGVPHGTVLAWLSQQRALLGDNTFRSILEDLLPDGPVTAIMNATEPEPTPDPPRPHP
ncbi:tetratricopeptide repeat protein, partial [Streptomyces sp. NPDC046909]|uniref:tetratricopeptide repeat protein n=1 Tax=Streptomyces sp. NPDC046909 TaxID=3155617 RepID=UPI00340106FD